MPLDTFNNLPVEKRSRVIEAATMEFAEKGYQRASVSAIASKAGVSKGSMYQYFEDKEALFMFIFDYAVQLKIQFTAEFVSKHEGFSFFGLLERLLISAIEYSKAHPYTCRIYKDINMSVPEEIRHEINRKIGLLGKGFYLESLKDAVEKGDLRRDISINIATFVVYTLLKEFGEYMADRMYTAPEEEIREQISQFIEVLKNGLKN